MRKEETDGRESTMVRRKKYKRQGITGKTPHLSVRFPLWYLSCHALVLVIPLFGTACTTLWYYEYRTVVREIPTVGTPRTKPRYFLEHPFL
ncbi:hypothetical protein [Bacteroides stercoris]|uniref:hypothetical protein n=1 Tax=Bacteroides stercoris TaxID=46506 RepID=UPI00189E6B56|nr:hypothetical protein [Bacteroides stercoris]